MRPSISVSDSSREEWAFHGMRALFSVEKWRDMRYLAPALMVGICGLVMSVSTWYVMAEAETRAAVFEFDS